MKYFLLFLFCPLFLFTSTQSIAQNPVEGMTNTSIDFILKKEATAVEGQLGNWQVIFRDLPVFILTDETNNRMRIFTPFAEEKAIEQIEFKKMLEANFHSALDAKYSIFNGFLITAFTHPLRELTRHQFVDAMHQVVTLALNFGTSYSSTDLILNTTPPEETEKNKPKERLNKKPEKGKN